ncbi:MAG: polysaccharide pyruvyl transferase family protein [Leptolyngbyaceae cyanobacterium bins.302]|nr:polysaccharide pyruvyl transferase family protein [Leptolyngbyaceae cyanobacterium bins.302]
MATPARLKTLPFTILETYAMLHGLLRKHHDDSNLSALFIPPAMEAGSLGDEAMLVGSIQYLREQGFKKIGIVSSISAENWGYLDNIDDVVTVNSRFDHFTFIKTVSRYSHFYCLGADTMDGYYSDHSTLRLIRFAKLAANTKAEVTILGFSFNKKPTQLSIDAISDLPENVRLCSRDPISHKRITQNVKRPVNLVADLAFLLQPAQKSKLVETIREWIQAQKAEGRIIIGVNLNNLSLKGSKHLNSRNLVQVYADALTEIYAKCPSLSFLMIPHDSRGEVSDVSLAEDLLQTLPDSLKLFCAKVPFPCRAVEIKAFCVNLDLVLTGRMHLAIACLGQSTPVAGITYQGKFEGLLEHFKLNAQELLIAPEDALQPGKLAEFMMNVIPQREAIKQQIQAELGKVQALARQNFANLEAKETSPVKSIQMASEVIS